MNADLLAELIRVSDRLEVVLRFQERRLSPDVVDHMIASHPDLQSARRVIARADSANRRKAN